MQFKLDFNKSNIGYNKFKNLKSINCKNRKFLKKYAL